MTREFIFSANYDDFDSVVVVVMITSKEHVLIILRQIEVFASGQVRSLDTRYRCCMLPNGTKAFRDVNQAH